MPLAILLEHMHKKFEINLTKIKGGYHSGRKVVTHNSKSDLPLTHCGLPNIIKNYQKNNYHTGSENSGSDYMGTFKT